MAIPGERTEAVGAFRFAVQIDGIDEAVFSECTLPNLEVDIQEQKEGGYNSGVHQLPGPLKPGKLVLKRGLAHSSQLLSWYQDVLTGNLKDVQKQVSVVMYDGELNEFMRWNFIRAFPVKWSGPSFKTADNAIAIETLELAYGEITFE